LRLDTYERPELHLGSYEFVATKDYCKVIFVPLTSSLLINLPLISEVVRLKPE